MATELKTVSVAIQEETGHFAVTVDPDDLAVTEPSLILWQVTQAPNGVTVDFLGVEGLPNPPFSDPSAFGSFLTVGDNPLKGTFEYPYTLKLEIRREGARAPFSIDVDPQITNTSD